MSDVSGENAAWIAQQERLIASYEAKVQELAAETLKSSAAYAALRRTVRPIMLAARLGEAPLYSGEFFDKGFPPEEREAMETALGAEDFATLRAIVLAPGSAEVSHPDSRRPAMSEPRPGESALLAEVEHLRAALALWEDFAVEASSMYESTLRYEIPRVARKAREASHSGSNVP